MDSVVCLNVLEHVEDDLCGLRNIRNVLKPGGRAIILVPHGEEVFGTLDTALGHYRRYSHEELQKKMEQAGFRLEHMLEFNRISRPGLVCDRAHSEKDHDQPGSNSRVFDRFVWLWRRIDRLLPWPPTSIIAIGQKV